MPLIFFIAGSLLGSLVTWSTYRLICSRKPSPPKILTSDNQGDGRQVIPVEVRIAPGEKTLEAAVVNADTGQRVAFAGCTATIWQQAVQPGADRCVVICKLDGVPVIWDENCK